MTDRTEQEIISFCAVFWRVEPSVITPSLRFDDPQLPNNTSIRFFLFMAEIEKHFQVRLEEVQEITTFGEVFKALGNSAQEKE